MLHDITLDFGSGAQRYAVDDDELAELIAIVAHKRKGPKGAARSAATRQQWDGVQYPFGYDAADEE
jgi:hypothetical protein